MRFQEQTYQFAQWTGLAKQQAAARPGASLIESALVLTVMAAAVAGAVAVSSWMLKDAEVQEEVSQIESLMRGIRMLRTKDGTSTTTAVQDMERLELLPAGTKRVSASVGRNRHGGTFTFTPLAGEEQYLMMRYQNVPSSLCKPVVSLLGPPFVSGIRDASTSTVYTVGEIDATKAASICRSSTLYIYGEVPPTS